MKIKAFLKSTNIKILPSVVLVGEHRYVLQSKIAHFGMFSRYLSMALLLDSTSPKSGVTIFILLVGEPAVGTQQVVRIMVCAISMSLKLSSIESLQLYIQA